MRGKNPAHYESSQPFISVPEVHDSDGLQVACIPYTVIHSLEYRRERIVFLTTKLILRVSSTSLAQKGAAFRKRYAAKRCENTFG
jgi:hypothetical protein